MVRNEDTIVTRLTSWLAGTGLRIQAVLDWHAETAQPGESLTAFLMRQQVFMTDAPRSLGLMDKGYLAASCHTSVLMPNWETRLREGMGITVSKEVDPSEAPPESLSLGTRSRQMASVRVDPVVESVRTTQETNSRSRQVPRPVLPRNEPRDLLEMGSMREPIPMEESSTRRGRVSATFAPSSRPTAQRRPSWPPSRGTVLGKYLLTEQIGKGTSGLVFRAINQVLNLSVAIKVLSLPSDGSAGSALENLAAEARLLASLNHPNVVRLWDFEADPATPYLVMEYVDGSSLAELIRASGRLASERAIEIIMQAAEGLSAAWEVGIVHRDVKPHNILVGRDGRPKIADLGLAVVTDESQRIETRDEMAGTAAYMSPEQGLLSEMPVDLRSDIYSLGATMYHALTGRTPYAGNSARELMNLHATSQPVPPHHVVSSIPPEVSEVVLTMMARHPDDRYYTATELLRALRGLAHSQQSIRNDVDGPAVQTRTVSASGRTARPSGFWRRLFTGGFGHETPG